jgi:drug/metabolite transporter superfamily protein YnfA
MSNLSALLVLALAALLEAGGDAVVRTGLHARTAPLSLGLIVAGGALLTAYGVVVNTPRWDFGRLLGVYVTLFFLAAQILDLVVFKTRPSPPVLVAGVLILAGGAVMTFWRA